ncbi:metal-dependent transcriptional regulator [Desulfobacca acetoxidans]|uniref:Transcriptional regulator MntR n=1 Tax=Desulfobacca acetoxidans (strain ATCC 700848 / DSM 11109 / ASRB2) TaxID=880072 RepID=F2NEN4_DESAR|nr:DtxR family transcriptional regulator [Desulfobacca acetoxidans]AEB08224.1 iron (metal) dependent repressor, DtxR family [Desulfobacca acetoxidans DSM 11109]HAY21699.1 DtxR family transcriptional regulator [Desulfobacterales bacterium]
MNSLSLSESLEDYLEAIFHIVLEKQVARVKDIASRLKVHKSSVTAALRNLADRKLVNYAPYDVITLTPQGATLAKDVVRRHEALSDFFVKVLTIDKTLAEEAACRMEHAMPRVIVDRLILFSEFLEVCPRAGKKWIRGFQHFCDDALEQQNCERCISLCLDDVKKKQKQEGGMMTLPLRELKPGQKGKILAVKNEGDLGKRIADMGITPGTLVEVERVAPLGDPIDIKVKGYHLSLRRDEATGITVELH